MKSESSSSSDVSLEADQTAESSGIEEKCFAVCSPMGPLPTVLQSMIDAYCVELSFVMYWSG